MQELLKHIHEDLIVRLFPAAANVPLQFIYIGGLLVGAGLIVGWMSLVAMGWIWAERRVAGYIQARYGPNRVGPQGILQSLADGIKLLSKEDIVPYNADRFLYELSPLLVFAGAFIPFVALPFSQHLVIADMDLGLFYVVSFSALEVVGILMAGWGPNSKWTLYGGMRLAAQMLSYEIPLGLSVLTVVMLAGSLNLTDIMIWQSKGVLFWDDVQTPWILDFLNWSIFRAPWIMVPAFLIFYVAGLAETKRAPFDLPEAESELVSGFHTEFTGIRFSYFFLAEYCAMYVVCVLGAILFFGGWHWPLPTAFVTEDPKIAANIAERLKDFTYSDLAGWQGVLTGVKRTLLLLLWDGPWATIGALTEPASIKMMANELFGFINLVGKSFFLMFVMLWVRWTLPRVRLDQVMHMCLKVLLPIGLACVVLASVQAVLTSHDPSKELRAAAIEHSTGAPAAQTKSEEGRSKDEKNDEASAGKDAAGKPAKEKTEEGKTEEKK